MPGIFISYRKKDAGGHAGRLHEDLARRYGRDSVFMDIEIRGGVDFRKRIHEALDSSDIALVLIGETWAASGGDGSRAPRRIDDENDLLRQEVAIALKHPTATVVPVVVEEAEIPRESDLPVDIAALPSLQVCRLQNSDWRSDFKRICRAVDEASGEAGGWSAASRAIRELPERLGVKLVVAVTVAAAALIAAGVLLGLESGGDRTPECANRSISPQARERLADAAGNPEDPVEGSVYYGSCGSRTWALAAFPDGTDGVFVQDDLEWVDLGRIAGEKCARVPEELLAIWKQDDC